MSFSLSQAYGKVDDVNILEISTQSVELRCIFEIHIEDKLYSRFGNENLTNSLRKLERKIYITEGQKMGLKK